MLDLHKDFPIIHVSGVDILGYLYQDYETDGKSEEEIEEGVAVLSLTDAEMEEIASIIHNSVVEEFRDGMYYAVKNNEKLKKFLK